MTPSNVHQDPKDETRWFIGGLVMLFFVVLPALNLATEPSEHFPILTVYLMVVGVLLSLGTMWPVRLSWIKRAGVAGAGLGLLAFPVVSVTEMTRHGVAELPTNPFVYVAVLVPALLAGLAFFFALTGRWPKWMRRGDGAGGRRTERGVETEIEGLDFAEVQIRGTGSRRLSRTYSALAMTAVLLPFLFRSDTFSFLRTPPLAWIVLAIAVACGLAGAWLAFTVMFKKVTWSAGVDGVRRVSKGGDDLFLAWAEIKSVDQGGRGLAASTLSLQIDAVDGRIWDLTCFGTRRGTESDFKRFSGLMVREFRSRQD